MVTDLEHQILRATEIVADIDRVLRAVAALPDFDDDGLAGAYICELAFRRLSYVRAIDEMTGRLHRPRPEPPLGI